MKNFFLIAGLCFTWLCAGFAVSAADNTVTVDGVIYKRSANHANVMGVEAGVTAVKIAHKVTIDNIELNVVALEKKAFYKNNEIISVDLGPITSLYSEYKDEGTFEGCTALKEVDLSNVECIGYKCFYNCRSLESVEAPAVQTVGTLAFANCASLRSISLGDGSDYITFGSANGGEDGQTFSTDLTVGCSQLEEFEILDDVTKRMAIMSPTPYVPVSVLPAGTLVNCKNLRRISLPKVRSIEKGAIEGCDIENMDLHNVQMLYLEDNAISGEFDRVTMRFTAPPVCLDAMKPLSGDITVKTLIVPDGCRDIYASDPYWGQFGTIIEDADIKPQFAPEYAPAAPLYGIPDHIRYSLNDDGVSLSMGYAYYTYLGNDEEGLPVFKNAGLDCDAAGFQDKSESFVMSETPITYNGNEYPVTAVAPYTLSCADGVFESIILSDNCESIGHDAFRNFHVGVILHDDEPEREPVITLGAGLRTIGKGAFVNVWDAKTFDCKAAVPPTLEGDDFFTDAATRSSITLRVPEESVGLYRSADIWSDFIIEGVAEWGAVSDITCDTGRVDIYTLGGTCIGNGTAADLPAGIYITRAADGTVTKLIKR